MQHGGKVEGLTREAAGWGVAGVEDTGEGWEGVGGGREEVNITKGGAVK